MLLRNLLASSIAALLLIAIGCKMSELATSHFCFDTKELYHISLHPGDCVHSKRIWGDARLCVDYLVKNCAKVHSKQKPFHLHQRKSPFPLIHQLQTKYPDAIVTTDSGNTTPYVSEAWVSVEKRKFFSPTDYSCMGFSLPCMYGACGMACDIMAQI